MNVDRLVVQPIAHRGLHDIGAGIIENSRAAVLRAVEAGYGFEVDVQITADGDAIVFHDDALDRLTEETGLVKARTTAELLDVPLRHSAAFDSIWTLEDLLRVVAGRVPAIIEIKTHWDGDTRLAKRTAELLAGYGGPAGATSFDPAIIAAFARAAPGIPRGIVGWSYPADDSEGLSAFRRWRLRNLVHWPRTRPHFISWGVNDLPSTAVDIAHRLTGAPVMAWTVRSPADQARAGLYADQMVFEGFRP
jgi:glycerophosphoryl diester phosphodiesterase